MIRDVVHDEFLLQRKAIKANTCDLAVAMDLRDTLRAHSQECVGMAANMIGVNKAIIVFMDMETQKEVVMFNPEIIKTSKETYQSEEGCLSLSGVRKTKRFQSVKVRYQDCDFKTMIKTYRGFTAQIIQHEMDHLEGILI